MKIIQKKLCSLSYKFEMLKMSINFKDVFNVIISILIIAISNIELFYLVRNYNNNYRIIIYNIIICLSVILMNIYFISIKKENIKVKKDLEIVEEKNRNLVEFADKLRAFKHDFNNILQAIDGYIFLEDINSLQVYFSSLLQECNYVNGIETLNLKIVDNPAIYGILINKYRIAEQNNIKMNIDILANLSKLNEKSYVVSRMLGILLDNALEATKECEEKIINVQFLKEENTNKKLIIIENTYKNKDIDTTKIFDKNFTTKKEQGNSGLGLWKIKNILSKDSSFELFTSKNENMFKQELAIYL